MRRDRFSHAHPDFCHARGSALRAAMTVPAGFVIEKVAGPPLIERPMMAGFDDRGRLFVAESAGLNFDFKKLSENPPNFIRLLIDSDRDGIFDKSTIFADRMTFPSGALWHDGRTVRHIAAQPLEARRPQRRRRVRQAARRSSPASARSETARTCTARSSGPMDGSTSATVATATT